MRSMAEAVAKEEICDSCGAEIRPDSLFCYSCGGSLEVELAEEMEKKGASDAWLREDIADESEEVEQEALEEKADVESDLDKAAIDGEDEAIPDERRVDEKGEIAVKAMSEKTDESELKKERFEDRGFIEKKTEEAWQKKSRGCLGRTR